MPPPTLTDPNWQPPILTGPRIRLRPLGERDADALFAIASNPNVTRFTLWDAHRSRDDSLDFLRHRVPVHYREGVPEPLGVELREGGSLMGCAGAHWASEKSRAMEFGYWIAEPQWGRGYAVEAARLLIGHLFAAYEVERVQAHCFTENVASARVLEKLGLQYEGTHRSALFHRGRFWDLKMFAVLRNEW
jgi:ribosomal-protein-alanine N-acetyltransferase